ncbi:MAG: hypothetical protein ACOYT9_00755 [Patescibacteria group bacterium]
MLFGKKRITGNVSLTTVIVVGALLIVSGMGLLANAIDVAMSTKSYFNQSLAGLQITSCVEEGMYKITKDVAFTGTVTVNYSDGNCQVVISNVGGNTSKKRLLVTAVVGDYTVTREKFADTTTSPMILLNE